ncbi:5'-nucleotidase C-terminal domain-containing protein [Candidatus Riflebacteria bacterium]
MYSVLKKQNSYRGISASSLFKNKTFNLFFITYGLFFFLNIPLWCDTSIAWIGNWRGKAGPLTDSKMYLLVDAFKEMRAKNRDSILLSCGSMLGKSIVSDFDKGKLVISIMNQSKVAAMAVGPHDFFAGSENLLTRASEADFPFICSNLMIDKTRVNNTKKWELVKPSFKITRGGNTYLILAVICPEVAKNWPNWEPELSFEDPVKAINVFKQEAELADRVIVLSNMSFADNLKLLSHTKWVDMVLTNPISSQIEEALDELRFEFRLNDDRRICWALPNDRPSYGLLKNVRLNGREYLISQPIHLPLDAPYTPEVFRETVSVERQVIANQGPVLCRLSEKEHNDIIKTYLSILRAEMNAEVAVLHESAISVEKVPVKPTALDIRASFPFPDRVALMNISGSNLRSMWNNRKNPGVNNQVFRVLGMKMRRNKLLVNGRPLRNDDTYRLATTEYLAGGGFGLLPGDLSLLKNEGIADLLVRFLKKTPDNQRARIYRRPSVRPVIRQKMALSGSYDQLSFSSSADKYQYKEPNALYTGSDIPGLVGHQHLRRAVNFDYEAVMDRPNTDTTFRLKSSYSELEPSFKLVDQWHFLARHTKKAHKPGFLPFTEILVTGAHIKPDAAAQSRPMFGRIVAGVTWKPSDRFHLLLGLGHLKRYSVDGEPGNTGLNLGFELKKNLTERIDFSTTFDGFLTNDSDKIKTFDAQFQLQAKLFKRFSLIMRERFFGWQDSSVGKMGTSRETFTGIGYSLTKRKF